MHEIPPDLIKTNKPEVWARFREAFARDGQNIDLNLFAETHPINLKTAYRWFNAIQAYLDLPARTNRGRPRKSGPAKAPKPENAPEPPPQFSSKPKRDESLEARRKYQEALDQAMQHAKPGELASITRARAEITSGMSAPKVNVDVQILLGQEGEVEAKKRLAETFQWLLEHDKLPEELQPLLQAKPVLVVDSDDA